MNTEPGSIFGYPLNRIVAFAGPYVSIASGVAASWLLVHIHFLGLFHVQHDGIATAIAQGLTLLLVSLLTWAGQSKWLTGHHIWMGLEAERLAASRPPSGNVTWNVPTATPTTSPNIASTSPVTPTSPKTKLD